jgi:hypothetical protein
LAAAAQFPPECFIDNYFIVAAELLISLLAELIFLFLVYLIGLP